MLNNKKKTDKKIKGSLNARSDAYVPDVYREKLDEILEDESSKNIAITAPYDSGKTTLLKSYFRERENEYKWYVRLFNSIVYVINKCKKYFFFRPNLLSSIKDYEFINIPNFLEVQDQKIDSNTEIQLEKSIIEQLLYKTNSRKYPDSNLGRLKIHSLGSTILNFTSMFFIVMYLIRIFVSNKSLKYWNDLAFWNSRAFQLISVVLVLIGSWKIFYWLIHVISNVKIHATTSAGPLEITGETESKAYQINLFNYYGDELQYYFKKNNIRIVIFEDLDRFNSPAIFQKLRELNNNLNKSGNKIVFIYSLKDRIFSIKDSTTSAAALKTKFFDEVIPIFPIHSYRDARKVFINEKRQYPLLSNEKVQTEDNDYFKKIDKKLKAKEKIKSKIDDKYLAGLGLYILDTREIKNIIFETNIYAAELPLELLQTDNAINKLLAMIVYKNEFPKDFDNLANGKKSKLEQFFKDIKKFEFQWINIKREANNKKIDELNQKINGLQEKLIPDLVVLMRIRFQQFLDNNGFPIMVGNESYSKEVDDTEIQNFWYQVLIQNLDCRDRFGRRIQITELRENEEKLFSDYLNNHEITINHIVNDLITSRNNLQKSNENIQKNILKLRVQDLLEIYLAPENKKILSSTALKDKGLKFIKKNKVLRYLIEQGLIGADFADYISPDPYNLTYSDEEFIRLAINHQVINKENYQLLNPKEVERELDILDDSVNTYRYAYSPNMLAVVANDDNKGSQYVQALIGEAYKKQHYKFILTTLNISYSEKKGLIKIVQNLLVVWPKYYSDIFNLKDEDEFKIELSDLTLGLLQDGSFLDLFYKLKEENIFAESVFEHEFLLLSDSQIQKILEQGNYLYENLSFVNNRSILTKLVVMKWYKQNTVNFGIIFEKLLDGNFSELINKKSELKLSDDYIKQEIWNFYQGKGEKITYSNIVNLSDFINDQSDANNYRDKLVTLYLDSNNKFSEKEQSNIIEKIHLLELIDNKKIEEDQIKKLINANKLIYNKELLKAIEKNYPQEEVTYVLKIESMNNLNEIFYSTTWKLTMEQLVKSKYKMQLVKEIDNSKKEFVEENCSIESLNILVNNTQSVEIIKHIMKFKDLKNEVKIEIIKRIFSDKKFKSRFSTKDISELVFNDDNYIDTWIKDVDGSHEISTPNLREKYNEQLHLLYDNVPQSFKKKGTSKFIFLTKFRKWLV